MAGFEIATASADDVRLIGSWAADEGWSPGRTDHWAFHAADPCGFLIGRLSGEPVVSISVVRYGADFAFLGCYIARPKVRGQGYGIKIWHAGMKLGAGRNVGLDGVPAQQANYRKSGFRLAWNNVRYQGAAPAGVKPPAGVSFADARSIPFDKLAAYDSRFFPAPRDSFLAPWITAPERAALVALKDGEIAGFGVIRAGAAASRVGPLYAASPAIASALVSALGQATRRPLRWSRAWRSSPSSRRRACIPALILRATWRASTASPASSWDERPRMSGRAPAPATAR